MQLDSVIEELIFDSPVDEVSRVVDDLHQISKSSRSAIPEVMRRYNIKNNVAVEGSKGFVVLSEWNQDGDGWFVDYSQGVRLKVDHVDLSVVSEGSFETDELCVSLSRELEEYAQEKFNDPHVLVTPDRIVIVGSKANPANFWNARWVSTYDFDGEAVKGDISVDVHYYEDGNVRLRSVYHIHEACDDPVKEIAKLEDHVEVQLQRSILELNEQQFKQLRRPLPVTRAKVQWGSAIGNYRLGKDVAQ